MAAGNDKDAPARGRPASKTRLFQAIRSLDIDTVGSMLGAHPALKDATDERGRNALHLLCSLDSSRIDRAASLELAQHLLRRAGIDVDAPAFEEGAGAFKATPLWYAISRGRNLPLARLLLQRGSTPEYCLWAAGFADDVEAIDLLVASGASVDPVAEDETPFLGAIKWSRFAAAERLLHHGANPNFQSSKGVTALHLLLKKNSDRRQVEMVLRHGADPTLADREGHTPLGIAERRRDKTYWSLLSGRR